jgi:hypothetical protein
VRQTVISVVNAVDPAFQYFVTAAELLRFLWHILLRFDQTQFPLAHEWTQANRKLDAAAELLSCVKQCSFCAFKNETHNPPVFNQLLSVQLISSAASSKRPDDCMREQKT